MAQGVDGRGGFLAGVDQILAQRTEDAVASRVDLDALLAGVWITPAAVALMTAVTPPDWA